ncbi:MAG: hypothetical protein COA78_32350 [Blastopirellula sp.]|nr:MAG: hypothetical protein COA78_32350 [Blastopirellula sp.]
MTTLLSGRRLKVVEFTEKCQYYFHESAMRSQNILDRPDVAPSGAFLNWDKSIPGNEFPGYMISSLTGLRKTRKQRDAFREKSEHAILKFSRARLFN